MSDTPWQIPETQWQRMRRRKADEMDAKERIIISQPRRGGKTTSALHAAQKEIVALMQANGELKAEVERLRKRAAAGVDLYDLVEQIALDCHQRYVTVTQVTDTLNKALAAYRIDIRKSADDG